MFTEKTILTGIKPTGTPHIGNLVGAIQPAIEMSNSAKQTYLFIADLHALNSVRDNKLIKQWTNEVAASFLAFGLDLEKTILFRQSDIKEVYEMTVLLTNVTSKGLMNRSHAYKAATDKNVAEGNDTDAGINMGLFLYPILMAADILLYQTDYVPVGQDQKQHVEFARDIAGSFNNTYNKELLKLPIPIIQENTQAIPGLDGRKMSKSYNNYIPIFAESAELKKLVMRIITDSKRPEEPKDPATSPIMNLYRLFADQAAVDAMSKLFLEGGIGYGDAKLALFEAMDSKLAKPRAEYHQLISQPDKLEEILVAGAERAKFVTRKTIDKLFKTMLGRTIPR